jgi:hypothetical protein
MDPRDGGALIEEHLRHLALVEGARERSLGARRCVEPAVEAGCMAVVVENSGTEETTSSAMETGGGAEADGTKPDITDIRLIGFRILPGISLSE